MGEVGNFLYGQIIVRSSLEQLFGSPFSTVMKLHDVRVGAVHAGAVLHPIDGIPLSVDAKASLVPVICGEGKRLFLMCQFRLACILLFRCRLRRGDLSSMLSIQRKGMLSERCNFLNCQEVVVILQEQFFRCAAISVNGLHEFGITAVHPYPVFHFIYRLSMSVEAKRRHRFRRIAEQIEPVSGRIGLSVFLNILSF